MNGIKKLRKKAGLTQFHLAECLSIEQSTISKWETGESKPRTNMLPVLAKALNCTIDELF